jgi:3-oxoacyl-[acyl-carrier protein] reductase
MTDGTSVADGQTFKGAIAVVTGATRGIGRATAVALARRGADVVVVGRSTLGRPDERSPGTLEEVVEQLESEGAHALAVQADLTEAVQVDAVIEQTLAWRGRCDLLVHNAGYTSNGPIIEIPAHRWQRGFQMQVTTPLQLCQGFVPGMLERGYGRVVCIGSSAAVGLRPGLSLYATSKLAAEKMTAFLDVELGGHGVSFNDFRIDKLVPTDAYRLSLDKFPDGFSTDESIPVEECAELIALMLEQPATWSGQVVGIDELTAMRSKSGAM